LIDRARLEDLVLARVSVRGARPPAPVDVQRAIEVFTKRVLSAADARKEVNDAVARLRAQALLEPRRLQLTGSGTDRLCRALGLTTLPAVRNWGEFKRRHLVRLLDKAAPSSDPSKLGLTLIARRLGISEQRARTPAALAAAALAKALNLQGESTSLHRIASASLVHR
jgi:hypothetical protein